jgi:hypothetical protein
METVLVIVSISGSIQMTAAANLIAHLMLLGSTYPGTPVQHKPIILLVVAHINRLLCIKTVTCVKY